MSRRIADDFIDETGREFERERHRNGTFGGMHPIGPQSRGRKRRGWRCFGPKAGSWHIRTIGVDLGGSHVMAAVVDESGKIVERAEQDIFDHDPDVVVKLISTAIDEVMEKQKHVTAIGLGSPGNVDPATGVVRYSPNFGWHDVKLGDLLRAKFDRTRSTSRTTRGARRSVSTRSARASARKISCCSRSVRASAAASSPMDGSSSAGAPERAKSATIRCARPTDLSATAARRAASKRKRRGRA